MPPVRRRSPRATPRRGRSSSVASAVSVSSTNGASSPPPSASKPKRTRKPKTVRPALPTERNPRLENHPDQPVRLQLIERENQEIIVGRVKLPSVNGNDHAFLLKRFDTDAVAATSMFRVAFPFADEAAEAAEMKYLETRYDTDRGNGGRITIAQPGVNETPVKRGRGRPRKSETPRKDGATTTDNESVAGSSTSEAVKVLPAGSTGVRLQGTWIPADDAAEVAQEYGILKFAQPLIKAAAKMAEDSSGPVLIEATPQKPAEKRGRPSKRAKKAAGDDEEEDQLAGDGSATDASTSGPSAPRMGMMRTDVFDESGHLSSITIGPYIEGMSADEGGDDEDDDEVHYSGRVPMPPRRKRVQRETIPEEEAATAAPALSGPAPLSQAEIDAQIEEAKALAAGVQRAAATIAAPVARGQKRTAVNDTPTADLTDALDDDEDYAAEGGRVVRAFRRGTRVARRRPVATTAGVLTAAGALGAAGAAYMTGVDVNTAFQTISQTVQSLGLQNWFF
ncbi:uncharacterized protein PFL1_00868 [Pseudozyma flocculosa PF-1]|uniref:HTH APSES-type domain-containing protein n=1 Tax=Pseudozyma flocculosa TaxID=84751 RepID=A0A5C3F4Q7_9BASI|nr:uncharacterized protein PFL1_00868 [Pseudozyma flocculosa PF-1]EPQ31535.1 hypothetical protein PFL1_00868 [Pseudozyma flocculosa PF-1]SPO38677.1 uncharacterized protein PSFLO_04156 [Pseudozyma flocculosa]